MNIGIIGYGYWGKNLVRIFFENKNCDLKRVADIDPARLKILKETYSAVESSINCDDIIHANDIDAVVIVSPLATHFPLTKHALENGKHVLVEKPFTRTSSEAIELYNIAEKSNLILMVSHTYLYNLSVRYIKNLITDKKFGDILYVNFVRTGLGPIRKDINAMWDLAPHDISIILYLLGNSPLHVTAFGQDYIQKGINDVVFLVLEFENKIIVKMHLSWLDPFKTRTMTIVGQNQMIVFDDVTNNEKIKIFDKGASYQPASGDFGEFQLSIRDGGITIPNIKNTEPLKNEIDHFLDCIINHKKPLSDAMSGYNVTKVLQAAQKSLDNKNKKITI